MTLFDAPPTTSIVDAPKIGALAPWFGSKRTMAPIIVHELGSHRAYWEPFCGSMATLLAKPPTSMETVNDLHDDLINLARVIQHRQHGPYLYRSLRRVLFDERVFHECNRRFKDELAPLQSANVGIHPGRAYDYFIVSWFGRNGLSGTKGANSQFSRRYTKNGGHAGRRAASAVESIPAWRRRMREVSILSMDAFELVERIEDAAGVVIYVDPPYLVKGAKYLHDFKASDHQRLATALGRFTKTRVVVSYYAHPDLEGLYPGWTVRNCSMTKSLVSAGMRDKRGVVEAPEVLLINGPSYGGAA